MWGEAVSSIAMPLDLIEFPADDLARARRFSTSRSTSGGRGKVRACRPTTIARRWGCTPVARGRVIASRCRTSASPISRGRSSASSSSRKRRPPGRALGNLPRLRGQPVRSRGGVNGCSRASRERLVVPRTKAAAARARLGLKEVDDRRAREQATKRREDMLGGQPRTSTGTRSAALPACS
jgi:hypothetical protein